VDIARQIGAMRPAGQIKVTVIRQTRVVAFAK
jgi:hypothetical protein